MSMRLGFFFLLFATVAQAATVNVNCAAGQSVQAAIDQGATDIAISGICVENVLVRDKDISLRGTTKPSLDGIRSATTTPALIVQGPVQGTIDGLSFSGSAGAGIAIRGANMALTNCLFENNGGNALQVNSGAQVIADSIVFNANVGRTIVVSDAQFFCTACDVTGNNFALTATRGAIASLLRSTVTGRLGILATDHGTQADIDCVNATSPHPCKLDVTSLAAFAGSGAVATLFAAGDFNGRVEAEDAGTVILVGARQLQAAPVNVADFFGRIVAEAYLDVSPPIESRLQSTTASHFGQILITDDTSIRGSFQCTSAADAWLDPTVIRLPITKISGCEHAF